MRWHRRDRLDSLEPIDELNNAYALLKEVMRNPNKCAYIIKLNKIKPMSQALINLKLLNKKDYFDWKIKDLAEEILNIIEF